MLGGLGVTALGLGLRGGTGAMPGRAGFASGRPRSVPKVLSVGPVCVTALQAWRWTVHMRVEPHVQVEDTRCHSCWMTFHLWSDRPHRWRTRSPLQTEIPCGEPGPGLGDQLHVSATTRRALGAGFGHERRRHTGLPVQAWAGAA